MILRAKIRTLFDTSKHLGYLFEIVKYLVYLFWFLQEGHICFIIRNSSRFEMVVSSIEQI